MASYAQPQHETGYDYEFIEEPSDDLKCLICLCVARDPQQHGGGGCGKIFCKNCIDYHKTKNRNCPNCRTNIVTFKDVRSERDIQSLKIKCVNQRDGCPWSGELRSLEDHLKICDYEVVPCPNKCTYIEAETEKTHSVTLLKKNLPRHLKKCPHRQYNCPHCDKKGEYKDITGEHLKDCPKVEIRCHNAPDCQLAIPRDHMLKHIDTCPYQQVSCMYKGFGCKGKLQRKDIKEHENDDKAHLQITMKTVLQQQQEILELKTQVQAIQNSSTQQMFQQVTAARQITGVRQIFAAQQHNANMLRLTCKLTKFKEKKEKNEEFYNNPFYTHPNGYKMIFIVDANGYSDYKGTYVSVWVYLMRGEYDDQLEFPFKGTITFELLNQLEDDNHHSKSFTHDGTKKASKRVVHSEQSQEAYGAPNFIRHENLDYDDFEYCQYLKDDCLVFRISVNMPSYKPWLHCP